LRLVRFASTKPTDAGVQQARTYPSLSRCRFGPSLGAPRNKNCTDAEAIIARRSNIIPRAAGLLGPNQALAE
jgi:hypothetical protein